MQPAASGLDGTGVKLLKGEVEDAALMNEAQFLQKKAEDVPVDQVHSSWIMDYCEREILTTYLLVVLPQVLFSEERERKGKSSKGREEEGSWGRGE